MARRKKDPPGFIPLDEDEGSKRPLSKDEKAWSRRLAQSKAFQKKYAGGWDENRRLIFNSVDTEGTQGQTPAWTGCTQNSIAYGWGLYEGLETSIYVQNPDILVTAREATMMPVAKRVQDITRYDIDQMDVKTAGNLGLKDAFICGYGATIEDVRTEHVRDEDGKPTGEVSEQEFNTRRIDPKDILFDRNGRRLDLSDSNYLFVAWYPTIQELMDDPEIDDLPDDIEKYPEASELTRTVAQVEGPAERQAATMVRGGATGEKDPKYKSICVWEVFDKVNHKKLYMTDFAHRIIGEGKWPANLKFGCKDLFPLTLIYQHPVPGRLYPMPEAELIAPQLREMNVLENMISEDTRTKWRKYLTIAGILTEDQKAQITDTTLANALIYVDVTKLTEVLGLQQNVDWMNFDLRKLVVAMEDVSPKKDLFQRYDMLEKEIQHIVGYGPAARGGLPSTRSAREAMMINQEKERKLDKRKSYITDYYALVAKKHVRYLREYMSVERYAKIYPKTTDLQEWFSYKRDDVQGDFEFEVLAGTSTPKNTETRKASEMQLFQAIMALQPQLGFDPRVPFMRLAEFMDWDGVDQLWGATDQKVEELAKALAGFGKGQVPPQQLVNTAAQAVQAWLGPAKLKLLAQKMEGGGGAPQAPESPQGQRGDPNPQRTSQGVP